MWSTAISTAEPKPEDIDATNELEKCLRQFNVFESERELTHRMEVLSKLNLIFNEFIKDLSIKQNVPIEMAAKLGGRIHTFGSFRLGVHSPGADIDALCIAPRNVQRDDFFSTFTEVLKQQQEVSECRTIEGAFVPVIKMNFDGIEIDLLFARLTLKEIGDDFDLSDDLLLKNLDHKCVRSLNGCRVTDQILRLVPHIENYRLALRAIKLWAKRREIYSNTMGYLGGVSWAMLTARICQLYPTAVAATIVQKFFRVFAAWKWPTPVLLCTMKNGNLGLPVWDPRTNIADRYHLMPIITPAYPQQNSTFNVSVSTKRVMQSEFERGMKITEEIMMGTAKWETFFEKPNFFYKYRHFLVLLVSSLSAADHLEWCGFVESKVRYLVSNLERNQYISLAHVNPKCFERSQQPPPTDKSNGDSSATAAESTFCSMWFIGLEFRKVDNLNVDLTENIQNFTNLVHKHASSNKPGMEVSFHKPGMDFEVRHVRRKQLNTYLDKDILNVERKKRDANAAAPANNNADAATASNDPNPTEATVTDQTPPEDEPSQLSKRQKLGT